MTINSSNNINLFGFNGLFIELKKLHDKKVLPNKIIFSGIKGIGKATFAYHLTNYIFSHNEENKYDYINNIILENNYSYKLVKKNTHPNFFLITNDEGKINIQISKIREMINFTNKSSFNDDYKIIIIDNVEHLNINSVNALLKIIEEPNNKIYFFLIHDNKINILDTFYCPHLPEINCQCRKPKPGMLLQAQKKYNIDMANSWMIGDKEADIIAANRSGVCNTILVRSGHKIDESKSQAKYFLNSINESINIITS